MNGLTKEEVQKRIAEGRINVSPSEKKGKTVPGIILSNALTFFNLLNVIFFVLILFSGSIKNGAFILFAVANTIIGIVTEIRSKRTLDRIRILTDLHSTVIRDGEEKKIPISSLVTDDIVILKTGDEIPTDALVLSGQLEVNESMLTGESDTVVKKADDTVFSGTFVTSGKATVRVIHVGKENYIETISGAAKRMKPVHSILRNNVNRILKIISVIIVPLVAFLFLRLYFLSGRSFQESIVSLVTSGIGMIPEGLFLLTSSALTLGVIRLAKKRTLVQELYCIEALARVDVLCLDKTGTLTEGRLKVEKTVAYCPENDFSFAFLQLVSAEENGNMTSEALRAHFGEITEGWEVQNRIPFSSDRKYSGVSFKGHGSYYMGAPAYLAKGNEKLLAEIASYAEEGLRVLVLAHTPDNRNDYELPDNFTVLGYVVMSDVIRKDCKETLDYFKKQEVALKCISGDDPLTASRIAEKCGLENADRYVDVSSCATKEEIGKLVSDYTVFGRVKPEQKKWIVECLQEAGHTVAMTGDGVNDVLAMKEADCSIAMASGAEATKHAANIVLLDSDFTAMPSVVNEGRRVINNIMNASSMFLIKTTFTILITLGTIVFGGQYPYDAIQFSIISGCAVGIPTFLMQFEPSFMKIRPDFMKRVFRNSFPAGLEIAFFCLMITQVGNLILNDAQMMQTICILGIGFVYFFMLKRIYSPMTAYRRIVAYSMEFIYYIVMILGQHILSLKSVEFAGVLVILGIVAITPIFIDLFEAVYDRYIGSGLQRMSDKDEKTRGKTKRGLRKMI